jgi:TPR repeat protein
LGNIYEEGGNLKKAKILYEAAAIAGHDGARYNLGGLECNYGNMEQAMKHWTIAASAGGFYAM